MGWRLGARQIIDASNNRTNHCAGFLTQGTCRISGALFFGHLIGTNVRFNLSLPYCDHNVKASNNRANIAAYHIGYTLSTTICD